MFNQDPLVETNRPKNSQTENQNEEKSDLKTFKKPTTFTRPKKEAKNVFTYMDSTS
jgi:hypothetical protein